MTTANPANRSSGIRDNYCRGSVGEFLRDKIEAGSSLSIVSAYFTIYAYEALKSHLDQIGGLRFLFGEPRFVKALDPRRTDKKAFKIEDEGLSIRNRLQQRRAAKDCADWIASKVDIRSVKQSNLLHGKMYHIAHNGREDAILGSSNFTVQGLGLGSANNNIELNLEVDSSRDRLDLKAWFDELWGNADLVEDVKQDVLQYLEQLYQNHSPEFIYYKTLFHIFEQFLSEQVDSNRAAEQSQLVDTDIWKALFEFQKDGVKSAINKILTHNGCIIADSVGLGKTYEALAIVKYFELRNFKVLVLCPKKLRENWTVYQAHNNSELNPFVRDRFAYTVLCHTDLSRDGGYSGDINLDTVNWGNYDLVVIDESHNFRNNARGKRDENGNVISRTRYERLMEDIIRRGVKTRVLLLSATPVNNDLKDLRNQLYFLTEDQDDAFKESLGIPSLKVTLAQAQATFTKWAKENHGRNVADLLSALGADLFKLLDELTIARSRKHIQRYYADSVAALGGFPARLRPSAIFPDIDLKHRFLSYDRLNDEIEHYRLSLFNPSTYVLEKYKSLYRKEAVAAFTQGKREHYLIGMMKVNFLKRLESSVCSFRITMERTIEKIEALEDRIARYRKRRASDPDLDFDELRPDSLDDEELADLLQVGQKYVYSLAHLDLDRWEHDLQKDKEQLVLLYVSAEAVTPDRDAKLAELKKLILAKVRYPATDKLGRANRKVLVFTAFADTAVYLYDALRDWATKELGIQIALVSGGSVENRTTFGKSDFNHILINFSPLSKRRSKMPSMPQAGEIDLLIATDCISEGQNLQDCDYLVNYDIHWNPVRIIQRFGRIDRIGSQNKAVQLVNFWPTEDLNKYINLKTRVEARMALVDVAATNEDNLLAVDELRDLIQDELKYRDKQLLRMKDEVLDLEDFNETVALNEFTLDDFRADLARYIESKRKELQDAPLGLYAVSPAGGAPGARQGVIFCLRQTGDTSGNEQINPLQPYFLVYVYDDRVIAYSFAQPKQILEIFRAVCTGQTSAYEELCRLFDRQTTTGAELERYNRLLDAAVKSIEKTYRKRAAAKLGEGRGGLLPTKEEQVTEKTDFDLITWLIIMEC